MKQWVVLDGETLDSIARGAKLPARRIWSDPANDRLRKSRVYTEALLPGDLITIPDPERKELRGRTGPEHDLWVSPPTFTYRVQLLVDGEPCKGARCEVSSQKPVETDDRGRFEFALDTKRELWATDRVQLHLTLPARARTPALPARRAGILLRFGEVLHELDFLNKLLTNLGFDCEDVDVFKRYDPAAPLPARTRQSFRRFRRVFGLDGDDSRHPKSFRTFAELHQQDQRALDELLRLHSQDASWTHRFGLDDKVGRLGFPHFHLFVGPAWNRINLLEGPEILVDAHMHVNSSKCSPLPLAWDKKGILDMTRWSRSTLDAAARKLKHLNNYRNEAAFAEVGSDDTPTIASKTVEHNHSAMAGLRHFDPGYLSMVVALPMDIEFGFIDGYAGQPVYVYSDHRFVIRRVVKPPGAEPDVTEEQSSILPPDQKFVEGPVSPADARKLANSPDEGVVSARIEKEAGHFYWTSRYDMVGGDLKRTAYWMYDEEWDEYQPYTQQLDETVAAAAANPWKLLPLFHYDPRRWSLPESAKPAEDRVVRYKRRDPKTKQMVDREVRIQSMPRTWREPFDSYFQPGKPRPFLGMKLYTALGYQPLDPRLPQQERFYDRCQELQLPVVCHCTPGGMYALNRSLFVWEHLGLPKSELEKKLRDAKLSTLREQTLLKVLMRDKANGIDPKQERKTENDKQKDKWSKYSDVLKKDFGQLWFSEEYVAPTAWLKVLQKYRKLRLCLAHFGGDEPPYSHWARAHPPPVRTDLATLSWDQAPLLLWDDQIVKMALEFENFYVDLSYFPLDASRVERFTSILETYPALLRKILFGTDWWMTELDGFPYMKFVDQNHEFLDRINPELWQRFAFVNPVRFYRLRENAEMIARWMKATLKSRPSQDSDLAKAALTDVDRGLAKILLVDPEPLDER